MDYDTLVAAKTTTGSIKYWINYDRIDSAGVLGEAEQWIYHRLRIHDMLAVKDVTISSGATTAALPTGYLSPKHFGIPGYTPKVTYWEPDRFRSSLGYDDTPQLPSAMPTVWSDFGGVMNFNSRADQEYTGKLLCYTKPTALSSSNTTNFLTDDYPTLLRRACLMFAAEARKEFDTMDRNEIKCIAMINDIKVEDDLKYTGVELDFNWEGND